MATGIPRSLRAAPSFTALTILAWLIPGVALAEDTINGADTAWIMTCSALVLLMTLPGLALFYGGLVRVKNILSVLMQCMMAAGLVGVLWVVVGYSLAFGEGNQFIGDFSMVMLNGITPDSVSGTIPTYVFIMFQGMFAIITPALMLGAFAERMRFSAYLVFITVWLFVVYIPLAHMVWGGGWIGSQLEAKDFAGGLVVHMSSGFSALVACIVLGPFLGRDRMGTPGQADPVGCRHRRSRGAGRHYSGLRVRRSGRRDLHRHRGRALLLHGPHHHQAEDGLRRFPGRFRRSRHRGRLGGHCHRALHRFLGTDRRRQLGVPGLEASH